MPDENSNTSLLRRVVSRPTWVGSTLISIVEDPRAEAKAVASHASPPPLQTTIQPPSTETTEPPPSHSRRPSTSLAPPTHATPPTKGTITTLGRLPLFLRQRQERTERDQLAQLRFQLHGAHNRLNIVDAKLDALKRTRIQHRLEPVSDFINHAWKSQVVGNDDIRQQLVAWARLYFMQHDIEEVRRSLSSQEMRSLLAQPKNKNILLVGPPGCGKTYLAKMVGGLLYPAKVVFTRVFRIVENPFELMGMSYDDTARKVRHLVEEARGGVLLLTNVHRLFAATPADIRAHVQHAQQFDALAETIPSGEAPHEHATDAWNARPQDRRRLAQHVRRRHRRRRVDIPRVDDSLETVSVLRRHRVDLARHATQLMRVLWDQLAVEHPPCVCIFTASTDSPGLTKFLDSGPGQTTVAGGRRAVLPYRFSLPPPSTHTLALVFECNLCSLGELYRDDVPTTVEHLMPTAPPKDLQWVGGGTQFVNRWVSASLAVRDARIQGQHAEGPLTWINAADVHKGFTHLCTELHREQTRAPPELDLTLRKT